MFGKKGSSLVAAAGIMSLAGGLWFARTAPAQGEPAGRERWEFATVEALQEVWQGAIKHSSANICYHTSKGCRWDTIRVAVDRWGLTNDALAAAVARLGENGWEPAGYAAGSVLMKRARPVEGTQ